MFQHYEERKNPQLLSFIPKEAKTTRKEGNVAICKNEKI